MGNFHQVVVVIVIVEFRLELCPSLNNFCHRRGGHGVAHDYVGGHNRLVFHGRNEVVLDHGSIIVKRRRCSAVKHLCLFGGWLPGFSWWGEGTSFSPFGGSVSLLGHSRERRGDVGINLIEEVVKELFVLFCLDGLGLRLCLGDTFCEILGDVPVVGVSFRLLFFALFFGCVLTDGSAGMYYRPYHGESGRGLTLAHLAAHRYALVALGLIHLLAVPLLAAVVGISFAVVVDDKVILVEAVSDNLLVLVLIDLLVKVVGIGNLVRVKRLLA
jgi:hypothetical protein